MFFPTTVMLILCTLWLLSAHSAQHASTLYPWNGGSDQNSPHPSCQDGLYSKANHVLRRQLHITIRVTSQVWSVTQSQQAGKDTSMVRNMWPWQKRGRKRSLYAHVSQSLNVPVRRPSNLHKAPLPVIECHTRKREGNSLVLSYNPHIHQPRLKPEGNLSPQMIACPLALSLLLPIANMPS